MKYIFEIKIKLGSTVEEYVEAWKAGSAIIQKSPGARGTRLYRKIGEPDRLLGIADWESKEARDRAMEKLEETDPATREVLDKHETYGEITKLGAYDETKWSVIK